jgi:Carbohydrate esterase, sialic acid-specific acetylesterase
MKSRRNRSLAAGLAALAGAFLSVASFAAAPPQPVRPAERVPDQSKPVQVFVLMGQSNMVGMGDINPETTQGTLAYLTKTGKKYPFLLDDAGQWTSCRNVYYYDARVKRGAPLSATANNGRSIGPEVGFGYVMGETFEKAPVLILKSCIGNRSLGWDLLPPGSERFVADGRTYAGYKDTPASWVEGQPKDTVNWYAGKQYDDDLANARAALEHLAEFYPGYKGQGYQIAGFVWWQGHKDQNPVYASRYEQNLARLIRTLRTDYKAPDAPFVLATIAFEGWKLAPPGKTIAEAQLAIADAKKHPEFAGRVKCVEARDFWRDASVSPNPRQGYHYNRNAETYMEVGLALGHAMDEILKGSPSTR